MTKRYKFLGRIHRTSNLQMEPAAQLVNQPALQGCQRCVFCYHFEGGRSYDDYLACVKRNKCGEESLLFDLLANSSMAASSPKEDDFSPSDLIKQTTIDHVKRYLQLWSSDMASYVCCSRCYFYPQRVAAGTTVAECSSTNACGQNASWWDLLVPSRSFLADIRIYFNAQLAANQYYTLSGKVVTFVPAASQDYTSYLYQMVDDNQLSYYICNMITNLAAAGYMLTCIRAGVEYAFFNLPVTYLLDRADNIICITDRSNPVAERLIEDGFDVARFGRPCGDTCFVEGEDGVGLLFADNYYTVNLAVVGDNCIVGLRPSNSNNYYYIAVGQVGTWLGCARASRKPSTWKKVQSSSFTPPSNRYVLITDGDEDFAWWLHNLGVSVSVFNNLFE